ncbi:hypothetical protein [Miltoncostaea oceani]|uniref:hypothetical protein n=1 Tax=Miltoncostaea oceani TaxID=2843216 RepID=UPI001C3D3C59|nr:hypothetical protein [Miltoncostaea oceani]
MSDQRPLSEKEREQLVRFAERGDVSPSPAMVRRWAEGYLAVVEQRDALLDCIGTARGGLDEGWAAVMEIHRRAPDITPS